MSTYRNTLNAFCLVISAAGITLNPSLAQAIMINTIGQLGTNGADGEGIFNTNGLPGGNGQNGADSSADAGFTVQNNDASNIAASHGGDGGSGGSGSSANQLVTASLVITQGPSLNFLAGGNGGNGGSGGNSSAIAMTTGDTSALAVAEAYGGNGGNGGNGGDGNVSFPSSGAMGGKGGEGGNGGSANARAIGVAISGDILASVVQVGGSGGNGGVDGQGGFIFSGTLDRGKGGNGADSNLNNAASGSTNGQLVLRQFAIGGNGGLGTLAGSAGNASSNISIIDSKASELVLYSDAAGGTGGNSLAGGTATATANGVSTIGSNVTISVLQNGGFGGTSFGFADGFIAQAGKGADSILNNAATGSTSGKLSLAQTANGGNGGGGTGIEGFAGKADSVLSITDSLASSLTLFNNANGGSISQSFGLLILNISAGTATSTSNGLSQINSEVSVTDIARGGNSLGYYNNGGVANSNATGSNAGNKSVFVTSNAEGGHGGNSQSFGATNDGGRGGDAHSSAVGSSTEGQLVTAQSTATGGNGGATSDIRLENQPEIFAGNGGNATAYASATSGKGNTLASATANGGLGVVRPDLISAQALSSGGKGSQATATATATGINLSTNSSVDNQSAGISEAVATIGQPLTQSTNRTSEAASAVATVLPQTANVQAALAGQSLVSQNFDLSRNSTPLLLADLSVLNTSQTSGLHSYQSSLSLSLDISTLVNSQDLLVGFLNPVFGNSQFATGDSLLFSYSVTGGAANVSDYFHFDAGNISSGFDFFNGRTLDLGALSSLVDENHILKLAFNLELETQTTGAGLDLGLIVGSSTFVGSSNNPVSSVPLPASVWFLASGMVSLLGVNRRKNKLKV